MSVNANSLAAGKLYGVKNKVFKPGVSVLPRKIVIVGTYDPSKATVVADVPKQVLSAEQVGAEFGEGFQLHRLALSAFSSNKNIETWVIPQAEAGGAAAAIGKLSVTGPATEDGSAAIYVSGKLIADVAISNGDVATDIATAINAAILAADSSLAIISEVNGVNAFEVDPSCKSKGTFGNDIEISIGLKGEQLPAGIAIAVTPLATGATDPDIQDALDALGQGDNQNQDNFTALIHGYGYVTATLDKISTYNGVGNDFVGNYKKEVARPFRSLVGDVSEDLAALIVLTDLRTQDRTNGLLSIPGSESHPSEFAALAMGAMEAISNDRAEQSYIDEVLSDVDHGDGSNRWTDTYNFRDQAVKSGISPTQIKDGAVTLQNVVTFYRPAAVPQDSNGYRSMRNISILQNVLNAEKVRFGLDKWKQITIVKDVAKVTNVNSRLKARDKEDVVSEILALAGDFEANAWIFSKDFTTEKAQTEELVTLRVNGSGFDSIFPIILSGEGGILNMTTEFDVSLAVFL